MPHSTAQPSSKMIHSIRKTYFGVEKHTVGEIGHDVQTQKRLHDLTHRLIKDLNLQIIRTPSLNYANQNGYEMALIDTSLPIYLGDRLKSADLSPRIYEALCDEVVTLWWTLWMKGFAAWDFKLYLQPDDTVMLVDYDKFGFRMSSGPFSIQLPNIKKHSETHVCLQDLQYFFENTCFPRNFISRLRTNGYEPPADCLPV